MLLRRVIEHVKTQNWTAVGLDFFIVVVGVFIGIQVANWNEARSERRAEAGYLRSLKEDVDFSITSVKRLRSMLGKQQSAHETLYLFSTDPDAQIPPLEMQSLLSHGVFHLPPLLVNQTTFEALKSSGRLGVIGNPELVTALQSVSAQIDDAVITQADEYQVTYLFTDPILVENFDMAAVFRRPNLEGGLSIPWLKPAPPPAASPAIMKSQRFANAILYRSYFTQSRLISVREIMTQYEAIAALIDARLAELGSL